MCPVSHVRCQMSLVTCHLSHVACYLFLSGEVSLLRVCYQQGLSSLVLTRVDTQYLSILAFSGSFLVTKKSKLMRI